MKKKVLSVLLVAAMTASMVAGCGSTNEAPSNDAPAADDAQTDAPAADDAEAEAPADDAQAEAPAVDYGSGELKIWVAENMVDLTKTLVDGYLADNGIDYTATVEPVGEGDAASNMLTDVTAGADIYGFPQDQLARLVAAGAVQQLNDSFSSWVASNNDAGSVAAAQAGGTTYAFPMTSDNGYFLYYDSSVVTDPSSLEQVIADCEAAGKNFYFDLGNAWYNMSFFFATGAECTFDTDDSGAFTAANVSLASDKGLVAMKEMIDTISSPAFVNGSSVGDATNIGAIVDGVWDSTAAQEVLGDNYACAKLPSFEGADGATYQLSGFGGFKLMGVKPQEEGGKLLLCFNLAQYLTDTDAQLARFEAEGWGPSNLAAQGSDAVKANVALAALGEQLAYCIPQGQYPGDWWSLANSLGGEIESGNLTKDSSDDDIMAALQLHDDTCQTFLQ